MYSSALTERNLGKKLIWSEPREPPSAYPVKLCDELEVEVDVALVAVVDQLEEVIVSVVRVVQPDVHRGPLLSPHLLLLSRANQNSF